MRKISYIIILLLFANVVFARSDLTIDINSTENKKITVIFEKVKLINNIDDSGLTNDIWKKIESNLDTTDLFEIKKSRKSIYDDYDKIINLPESDLVNYVMSIYSKKDKDGKEISDIDAVLTGYAFLNKENFLELKIRLWDILDQRDILNKSFTLNVSNWKRIADIISDSIYELLTGEISGHFDTKILFVSESGQVKNRKKKIAMMDFDGSNLTYLTTGENLVLTPAFSKHNKDEVVYLEYRDKKPHIYRKNLATGKLSSIGSSLEMTYAPSFNPNGSNEILFSATKNGISNIYKLDFNTGLMKQLTFDNEITTVPSWSPDGEKIVFVSDKTGIRKLYVMNKDGTGIERISKGRGVYDKPSWSPDGKLISFVKLQGGEFYIGLMTPDGENERLIMNAYLVEGIKWSPNGRYLIYSKQKGPFGKDSIPGIYTIDILTGVEYKLNTPENQGASDPDWVKK